jgi:hypothetical protein
MAINVHNSCDGKIRYENEIAVQYHLHSNNIEGIEDYYVCQFCGGFHVYTIPGKKTLSSKKIVRNYQLKNKTEPRKMKMSKSKSGRKGRKF